MDKYFFYTLLYQRLAKPIFFLFDPHIAHDAISFFGSILGKSKITRNITSSLFSYQDKFLETKVAGIKFKNPVGLSAGFDKDGKLTQILPYVGFGFMVVGSVTDKPYKGNPKPWLYRLKKSKSIVVYYGLKNQGIDVISKRLKKSLHPSYFRIGISIAKTNAEFTNTTKAGIVDYFNCYKKANTYGVGDFFTINISCPNTFGGEPFTTPAKLDALLSEIDKVKTMKPVFVKMPINLSWREFDSLLKVIIKHRVTGVTIGNLNKDHKDKAIIDTIPSHIKGGVSGLPTQKLSNELISKTYQKYGKKLVIIGVGGIFSAEDAYEKIKRGASLVQLITGLIYEGPHVIGRINKGLTRLAKKDGYKSISEAVGVYHRA